MNEIAPSEDPADDDPSWAYFFIVRDGRSRDTPSGVVRRRVVDGVNNDRVLGRDGLWHFTGTIRLNQAGLYEHELVAATRGEALAHLARRYGATKAREE